MLYAYSMCKIMNRIPFICVVPNEFILHLGPAQSCVSSFPNSSGIQFITVLQITLPQSVQLIKADRKFGIIIQLAILHQKLIHLNLAIQLKNLTVKNTNSEFQLTSTSKYKSHFVRSNCFDSIRFQFPLKRK